MPDDSTPVEPSSHSGQTDDRLVDAARQEVEQTDAIQASAGRIVASPEADD